MIRTVDLQVRGDISVASFYFGKNIKQAVWSNGKEVCGCSSGFKIRAIDCSKLKIKWSITQGSRLLVQARIRVRIRLRTVSNIIVEKLG